MPSQTNRRRKTRKPDITLMTLLAYEATSDARKLLKKYGAKDARGYADLEQRLSELYVSTPDKVQLEKDLAAIHPHKKWLLKTMPPVEVKVEKAEIITEEKSSNADGCDCKECRAYKPCPCTMNRNWEQKSGADGSTKEKQATSIYDYAGPMGMLIVFGIFVIALRGTNR